MPRPVIVHLYGESDMAETTIEELNYGGELPEDREAFARWTEDLRRGKGLSQLRAIRDALARAPHIRAAWSPRTFTPVRVNGELFDAITCNLSYHFNEHGSRYGTIEAMTREAQDLFLRKRSDAVPHQGTLLKIPKKGIFELDGRIVSFF